MERSHSPETRLTSDEASTLLDLADGAVLEGLAGRSGQEVALHTLPERLHRRLGSFVTLTVAGELNGCIGHVEGIEPLGRDVAHLAWSAAFADPRLPALDWTDRDALTIEISILSALTPVAAGSHEQLIGRLRPAIDGLMIRSGRRQGLFLPSVWEQLPEPRTFVDQLLRKAGLPPGSWSVEMEVFRFDARKYRRHVGPDAIENPGVRASR